MLVVIKSYSIISSLRIVALWIRYCRLLQPVRFFLQLTDGEYATGPTRGHLKSTTIEPVIPLADAMV